MPSIGEIDLDISRFESQWDKVIEDVGRLEPEIKDAIEILKLFERDLAKLKYSTEIGHGPKGSETKKKTEDVKEQRDRVRQLSAEYKKAQREVKTFHAQNARIQREEAKANKSEGVIERLRSLRTNVGLIFSGVAGGGLLAFGKSLINFGTQIKDTAMIAGVLPEKLQRIQAAFSDKLTAENTASALTLLNKAMKDAREGSTEAELKLADLGVTFEDIQNKTPDQVILQLADHVRDSVDPVAELQRVTALFGEELGAKLMPVLLKGSENLKELADSAIVADDAVIDLAASGAKHLERFGTSVKQYALQSVAALVGLYQWLDKSKDKWAEYARNSALILSPLLGAALKLRGSGKGTDEEQESDAALAEMQKRIDDVAKGIRSSGALTPEELSEGKPGTLNAPGKGEAKGKAKGKIKSPPKPDGAVSQGEAELALLSEQGKIAKTLTSENEKQRMLLDAQGKRIDAKLQSGLATGILAKAQLTLQKQQNDEAKRALELASKLRDSTIQLNEVKSNRGRGYESQRKVTLAEIADIENQIKAIGDATNQQDKQKLSSLRLQKRETAIQMLEAKEANDDQLYQLGAQTNEMEAQYKGLTGIATQVAIIAKYDAEITKQLRLQNNEAVDLLKNQKDIALKESRAAEHGETPEQRRLARKETRVKDRKARQMEAREEELRRRGAAGQDSFAIRNQKLKDEATADAAKREADAAIPIQDRIDGLMAKDAAIKGSLVPDKQKAMQLKENTAKLDALKTQKDTVDLPKNVASILGLLESGK